MLRQRMRIELDIHDMLLHAAVVGTCFVELRNLWVVANGTLGLFAERTLLSWLAAAAGVAGLLERDSDETRLG